MEYLVDRNPVLSKLGGKGWDTRKESKKHIVRLWNPPLRRLILAMALSGCAVTKVKAPVRISERITLEEGYRIGTLQYAGDELKLAKKVNLFVTDHALPGSTWMMVTFVGPTN